MVIQDQECRNFINPGCAELFVALIGRYGHLNKLVRTPRDIPPEFVIPISKPALALNYIRSPGLECVQGDGGVGEVNRLERVTDIRAHGMHHRLSRGGGGLAGGHPMKYQATDHIQKNGEMRFVGQGIQRGKHRGDLIRRE